MRTTSQANPLDEGKVAHFPPEGPSIRVVTGLIIVVVNDGSHEMEVRLESIDAYRLLQYV
jgi:hypothetical protein